RLYVSQLTPSTHVPSPADAPPRAVPSQLRLGPVGPIVPPGGFAAFAASQDADPTTSATAIAGTSKDRRNDFMVMTSPRDFGRPVRSPKPPARNLGLRAGRLGG